MKGETVTLTNIEKRYSGNPVVSDVSIDIRAGEFLSLLGPSGSGKTTLLMMIAGFELPSRGAIHVGTRDITHVAPNKRHVGMVFQKYAIFPHMTVAQNIAFPLKMRGVAKVEIRDRIGEMLSLVQLSGYEDRYPQQLSGGQQQRVAVARALVFEPPVLLMDEPLSALDKKLRETMQLEIKRIQQRVGVTVVYVTHDQEEALTMSDRVAVMSDGKLAQIGSPFDLYQQPSTAFVADFVGKMNFVEADYLGSESGEAIVRFSDKAQFAIACGTNGHTPSPGKARVAIRPEHLTLSPRGASNSAPRRDAIPGTVEAVIFVGSHHIFLVRIDGRDGEPLQVQLMAKAGAAPFRTGDAVDIMADPGSIKLFPPLGAGRS